MIVEVITKQFILCPYCGKSEHCIQHLLIKKESPSWGPWLCRECNHEFSFQFKDGEIFITKVEKRKAIPMLSLLKFRDLYVVVERFSKIEDKEDWYDYLFHSHQCPTNIMGDVIEVFDKDEVDPHGLFRFIAALEDTEYNRSKLEEVFKKEDLFELFETDGSEAPTAWPEEDKGVLSFIAEARYKKEKDK